MRKGEGNRGTVTQGRWSVSVTTGTGIEGAILNVARHFEPGRDGVSRYIIAKGDADGMLFASSDEARAFAFERGYTQPYVSAWCDRCRVRHTTICGKGRSGFCHKHGVFVGGAS